MSDDNELREALIIEDQSNETVDIRLAEGEPATIVNANDELDGSSKPSCFETCYTSIAVIACCPVAAVFRCVLCPFVSSSVFCCERNRAVSVSYTRISREDGAQIVTL